MYVKGRYLFAWQSYGLLFYVSALNCLWTFYCWGLLICLWFKLCILSVQKSCDMKQEKTFFVHRIWQFKANILEIFWSAELGKLPSTTSGMPVYVLFTQFHLFMSSNCLNNSFCRVSMLVQAVTCSISGCVISKMI